MLTALRHLDERILACAERHGLPKPDPARAKWVDYILDLETIRSSRYPKLAQFISQRWKREHVRAKS